MCKHCLRMRQTQLCCCCVHYVPCVFTCTVHRTSEALSSSLSVLGDSRKGRLAHWFVDAIAFAYQAQGML